MPHLSELVDQVLGARHITEARAAYHVVYIYVPPSPRVGKSTCRTNASTPFSVTFPGSQNACIETWNGDTYTAIPRI